VDGTYCTYGKEERCTWDFDGEHDGKLSFRNLDVEGDHVKMDLKEIGWEIPDCTDLVQEMDN